MRSLAGPLQERTFLKNHAIVLALGFVVVAHAPFVDANSATGNRLAGPNGAIEMYCIVGGATDFGCCDGNTLFIPGTIGSLEIAVVLRLSGSTADGFADAEFYIDGVENLPAEWECTFFPAPGATYVGDACAPHESNGQTVRRANVVFPVSGPLPQDGCQIGDGAYAPLGTIRLQTLTAVEDIELHALQVVAGDPPGSPNFDCPNASACDNVFTRYCLTGNQFVINNGLLPPINPSPADATTGVPHAGTDLSWESQLFQSCLLGVEWNDVYFGKASDPPLVFPMHSGETYSLGLLEPHTTYYWRVTRHFPPLVAAGPVWTFTTGATIAIEQTTWTGIKQLYR